MTQPSARNLGSATPVAIWIVATIASLWFLRAAKSLLIPIALAVLISYALEPLVVWLEQRRIHRGVASAIVLLLVLAGLAGTGYVFRDDARQLVGAVPQAVGRARDMVASQIGAGNEAVGKATEGIGGGSSSSDLEAGQDPTGTSGEVPASLVQRAASAVFTFAGHFVVIVFLVFFLLLSGSHLKQRLVEVAGRSADQRETIGTIVADINMQIQRYLVVLLVTGTIVGLATWLVLSWMDVEHALMWGLLAGVFNSIPYFGPVIVSGGLFVVGIVQGGGMTQALWMSGASVVITSLEGWLITPALMGKVEHMSALVVFLGLLLWTWMWGAWGTVLAVPMLAILKSVADHVPQLRPVGRLMAP